MDTSEIQRSAELFEELIKCCSGDAMGEVWLVHQSFFP